MYWNQDRYRVAAGITAVTLLWFVAGVAAWPDVEAPVWYRIVLAAGVGVVFWCVVGWLGVFRR